MLYNDFTFSYFPRPPHRHGTQNGQCIKSSSFLALRYFYTSFHKPAIGHIHRGRICCLPLMKDVDRLHKTFPQSGWRIFPPASRGLNLFSAAMAFPYGAPPTRGGCKSWPPICAMGRIGFCALTKAVAASSNSKLCSKKQSLFECFTASSRGDVKVRCRACRCLGAEQEIR